jgi:transcription antitermination factor NusG
VEFAAFTEKDFDAYLDHKWQSNAFNRERLEVKEKLLALGRIIGPAMRAVDGSPLECEVSAEHPALWNQRTVKDQHLFFSRSKAARKEIDTIISKGRSMAALIEDPSPLRNHIFLSVMINKDQVELALKLHSDATVDRENLQRKCQEFFQREKLLRLINGLPAGFFVGLAGGEEVAASGLDDEQLQRLIQELPGAGSWLVIRRSVSRDEPLARESALAQVARDALSGLLPVMDYIAWSRDNDHVSMRDTLRQKEAKTKSKGLAKKDRIRVVRGMFSGKTGVVQQIDAKGGLKVRLGSMLVNLSGEDVVKL